MNTVLKKFDVEYKELLEAAEQLPHEEKLKFIEEAEQIINDYFPHIGFNQLKMLRVLAKKYNI